MAAARKRTRIELLDIAKAITIFLVIVGHTTSNTDTIMYRRVLYAFHMPLFFFLAGMSTKPKPVHGLAGYRTFLKKNILALVVPFVVWGLVYAPFSFSNFSYLFYASWAALGKMGTLTSLWYLSAFFVARIIVQLIISVLDGFGMSDKNLAYGLIALPMFAIGLLLPYLEQGYPWCLDVAFVATGIILLGMALRRTLLVFAVQTEMVLIASFVASLALLILGTVARGDACDLVLMCGAQYGNLFWFFVNSASGTMVVLTGSMLLCRLAHEGANPFSLASVSFIGMHTMGIFLLHKPMLQEVLMPFCSSWIPGPQLLAAIVASIFALILSMGLCVVIEHYIPELLGQFPVFPTGLLSQRKKKGDEKAAKEEAAS
ncbi:MAG: acyltransferase family protein [Coriobacteriales bacterium]|nr:acyltransferase family protein [Coriobacteriales bacterium]